MIQLSMSKAPCSDFHLVSGDARWRRCKRCDSVIWMKKSDS